jgi:hypothetical protein
VIHLVLLPAMKILCTAFLLFLACACATPGALEINTPVADSPGSYPPVIESSASRQQAVEDAWRLLLAEFQLPETRLELHPVTLTPKSLPENLAGQMRLEKQAGKFDANTVRESLRKFLERARTVLSGDPRTSAMTLRDISLVSFREENGIWQAVYKQMNFPYPVLSGYGEIRLSVDQNGRLTQMSSTYLSTALLSQELTLQPKIEAQSVAEKMTGREFIYSNIAGQQMKYQAADRSNIIVKELVIMPMLKGERLELHLAWLTEIGRGPTWSVFTDAINGTELGVKQNFVS